MVLKRNLLKLIDISPYHSRNHLNKFLNMTSDAVIY